MTKKETERKRKRETQRLKDKDISFPSTPIANGALWEAKLR